MKFVKIISLVIISVLFILSIIITCFYYFGDFFDEGTSFMTTEEWKAKNTPKTKPHELNWSKGVYEIYYIHNNNLFSQMSDGSNKKALLDDTYVWDYYIAEKRIVVFSNSEVILIDHDGTNKKTLHTMQGEISYYDVSHHPRMSANKQFIVFDENIFGSNFRTYAYVINIPEETIYELDKKKDLLIDKNLGKTYVSDNYWYKDNVHILFITNSSVTGKDRRTDRSIIFNTVTKKSKLIDEFTGTIYDASVRDLSEIVDLNQLVDINYETKFYDPTLITSPDRNKTIEFTYTKKTMSMNLNNDKVIEWDRVHSKLPTFKNFKWLPDNEHVVLYSYSDKTIRIVETSTQKVIILAEGENPKFVGQYEGMEIPSQKYK